MKTNIQKLMNGKLGFLIPLLFYTALIGISNMTAFISVNQTLKNPKNIILIMAVPYILSIVFSYLLAFLYSKNKKWILGFVALYIFIFVWSFILGNQSFLLAFGRLISALPSSFIGIILYVSYDWFRKHEHQKELEKQNLQSELQLLKNQINPHFLFNTLNNIDSLIRSNPEKASNALVQISGIMRYMIYETNTPWVPLKKELEYIENYLHLQHLQYANLQLVDYSVKGNPDSIQVAPMLFIPFIENAFKHCTDKTKTSAIRICFEITDKQISFFISNIADQTQSIHKDETRGIGLNIVKRRLDIIYPEQYTLCIKEINNLFCVTLSLKTHD